MKRYEKDWKGFDDWRTTTVHHEEVRQNALKKMGMLWEYMGILTEWQCPMSDSKSVAALPPRLPLLLSCSAQQLLHELDKESSHELPHCKNVQNTKLKQTQSIQSVDQNAAKWCKTVQNGTTWCKMHVLLEAATKEDSMFMGTLGISMHYIALLWLHMFALGCNQIMDCGTPPVHSRSPWAARTSVDRSARDANARVHIRVGMMANVFTHTLVTFRSYFSEPCPLPNTLLWHIRTEDFYRRDFLAESFKQIKFEIPTFWLGLSAIPVQVCKGHDVAPCCTILHHSAWWSSLYVFANQSCWSSCCKMSSSDARAFERLWERSLACNSTANDFYWKCSVYSILGNTEESFSLNLSQAELKNWYPITTCDKLASEESPSATDSSRFTCSHV